MSPTCLDVLTQVRARNVAFQIFSLCDVLPNSEVWGPRAGIILVVQTVGQTFPSLSQTGEGFVLRFENRVQLWPKQSRRQRDLPTPTRTETTKSKKRSAPLADTPHSRKSNAGFYQSRNQSRKFHILGADFVSTKTRQSLSFQTTHQPTP